MKTCDAGFISFTGAAEWEAWLAEEHDRSTGVWLLISKKGTADQGITIGAALDVALCFGWIDSHRKGYDEQHYLQRYSPRRPKSPWSQVNVEKAEALIAAARMREPGLAAIRAAEADGRWASAYQRQRDATVPPDLAAALAADGRALDHFEQLDRTRQYALFLRLMKARTPDSRAARVARIVADLARAR
ncbi:YdeI family protein [Nocardia brasiliensis]|uniref:YdeI/OmpD-associated family protein n=1 Tax=Nocardia brasiliensis TaxID=37326 RepID=UPI003671BC47